MLPRSENPDIDLIRKKVSAMDEDLGTRATRRDTGGGDNN